MGFVSVLQNFSGLFHTLKNLCRSVVKDDFTKEKRRVHNNYAIGKQCLLFSISVQ